MESNDRLVNSGDVEGIVDRAAMARFVPSRWEPVSVSGRMVEAFVVLDRLPMTLRPRLFGSGMPAYFHDDDDKAGWQGSFKTEAEAEKNNESAKVRGATSDQMTRMVDAIDWPSLIPDVATRRMVGLWALARARRRNVKKIAERVGLSYSSFNRIRLRGLREIARKLNARGEAVVMHRGIG